MTFYTSNHTVLLYSDFLYQIYTVFLVKQVHKENYYNKSKAYMNMMCIGRWTYQLILILRIAVTTVIIIYNIDQKSKFLNPKPMNGTP